MSQEPKKRHSRARQGKRRAAIKLVVAKAQTCPNCGVPLAGHTVCKNCGYYKGKLVVQPAKKKNSEAA